MDSREESGSDTVVVFGSQNRFATRSVEQRTRRRPAAAFRRDLVSLEFPFLRRVLGARLLDSSRAALIDVGIQPPQQRELSGLQLFDTGRQAAPPVSYRPTSEDRERIESLSLVLTP